MSSTSSQSEYSSPSGSSSGRRSPHSSTTSFSHVSSASEIHHKHGSFGDSRSGRCNAIIFDLGDVLFTWSPETKTSVSPKLLHKMLRSVTWFEYEKDNLGEQETYDLLALEFSIPVLEIASAFQDARDSLQSNTQLIALIRELKHAHGLSIFAMSNISAPDWAVLQGKAAPDAWALFDRVFTSAGARERKPNLGFYRQVLAATRVDPLRTVFVDDKLENVLTARSVGLKGVVFDSFENVARQLRNYVADPVGRGENWLRANAKKMLSVTDGGVTLHENFSPLLILEATGDRSLVEYVEHPRLFNFFQGEGVLTTADYPSDFDTTSIGLSVSTHLDEATKHSVMNEMLTYRTKDGIVPTYFDKTRPRIDPIVCTNVLTLFHTHGRGAELSETLDWVLSVLQHRAYLDGTLYYPSGDAFLFFLARLLTSAPVIHARCASLFTQRVRERLGAPGDAIALAMRVTAAARVGVCASIDYERLLALQEPDGSWSVCWVYRYGTADVRVGNRGLTTALAVQAIKAVKALGGSVEG